ncbi:MAG: hypothetical protein IPK50_16615 [Fibrobacterota bacterium]|nr:hypothetical protein [Fibrobacterota bacterium]QQS03904.1 MAG: hypothetical protein IPK50_16615 [Fibrobacterota bacterium]
MTRQLLFACGVLALVSCDDAKKFIDPTGNAYKAAPDTSAKGKKEAEDKKTADAKKPAADNKKPAAPTPAPAPNRTSAARPAGSPPVMRETTIQPPAHRNDLTAAQAWIKAQEVRYQDGAGSLDFKNGIARRPGEVASLMDSKGAPWGIAQGDVDMDGADDVVVVIRVDARNKPVVWKLALLRNQNGRLFNNHTVPLPGTDGFTNITVNGNQVTLVPVAGGANVHASYSGGSFSVD